MLSSTASFPRLALLFAASVFAARAQEWTRLVSPHFELFTNAGAKQGSDAILYFEQAHDFFEKASPVSKPTNFPVRLILFDSERSYAPFRITSAAIAYFTGTANRDYIIMGSTASEGYRVALHEYMHVIVKHSGLRIPVWLSEGWADVYSTLRPTPKGVAIGDMLPDRVQALSGSEWLTFERLTSVTHDSPEYNEANRAGLFYAESWALVHMVYLAPDYKAGFARFINALHQGRTAEEACLLAWNKSSAVIFNDLRNYLQRKKIFGTLFVVKLDNSETLSKAASIPRTESDLVLADLLLTIGHWDQAEKFYRHIAEEQPANPDVQKSFGYLAWARGDKTGAKRDFERAADLGCTDSRMYLDSAILGLELGQPPVNALAALSRAVSLKPDYMEARLELGLTLTIANQPAEGLKQLLQIKAVDSEHAARLFNSLALAYGALGNYDKSRDNAEKALKWSKTDLDKREAESTLQQLRRLAPRQAAPSVPKPN